MVGDVSLPDEVRALGNGEKRVVPTPSVELVVCRVGGQLYAFENCCSHRENPLDAGEMNGYLITCPLHSAQFDVRDGSHKCPPAWTGIRTFPVTEGDEAVTVEMKERPKPPPSDFGGPMMTR